MTPVTLTSYHPLINYSGKYMSRLSDQEMKDILTARRKLLRGDETRADLQYKLAQTPFHAPDLQFETACLWKASFIVYKLDLKRKEIAREDLVALRW